MGNRQFLHQLEAHVLPCHQQEGDGNIMVTLKEVKADREGGGGEGLVHGLNTYKKDSVRQTFF